METEERRIEAFLARGPLDGAGTDPGDAALLRELATLREGLDAGPEAPPELVARTVQRARAELAASHPAALAAALARMAVAVALPLAVAVLWNAAVWWWGPSLLASWLPEPFARGIPTVYVFGAAGWLALVCAALPSLAHHALVRRHREALS